MPDDHRRQILWADDEIDLLRPHIKFLEQKGFAVTPRAQRRGRARGADGARASTLVLLDEMMPGPRRARHARRDQVA
jgi:DNA-binding response OmpR family regulator